MEEQRTVVKFYVRLGKDMQELSEDLVKVYAEDAMAPRTIRKWVQRFKEGRASTEDNPREGRPSTSTTEDQIEEVRRLVNDDPKITTRAISRETNISLGSVVSILHDKLNMSKISARWVPRLLTSVHRQTRVELCNHFINQFDRDPENFISRIVTGDETWLYGYDPATKQMSMEWRVKGASPPVKPLMQKSVSTKVMTLVFYDGQGVIHHEYLNPGETVTASRYVTALSNLRQAIRQKRRGKLSRGVLFHHDNAPAHRSRQCVSALSHHGFEILPHPPYSPDLSPCDFHLFPQIKRQLKGRRFNDVTELKQAFEDAIGEKTAHFFEQAFHTWRRRAEKCVISDGDYVEK